MNGRRFNRHMIRLAAIVLAFARQGFAFDSMHAAGLSLPSWR
jgi:hypothetical protein